MTALAIIVLGETSIETAQRIKAQYPQSTIYGLAKRTQSADLTYQDFGETVRTLFQQSQPIIGLCSAGILIRSLAPILNNKWQEPAVLAAAEDGSSIVPLLGSLQGANDIAKQLAEALQTHAAITTTGSIRFQTTLLSPPLGYQLAFPEQAKTFVANLLSGQAVKIEGEIPWLEAARLPQDSEASHIIQVTPHNSQESPNRLIYHPKSIAIFITNPITHDPNEAIAQIQKIFDTHNLSTKAIAIICTSWQNAHHPTIQAVTSKLNVPLRLIDNLSQQSIANTVDASLGQNSQLIYAEVGLSIAIADQPIQPATIGQAQGELTVLGTGPGSADWLTPEALKILKVATDWVGYKTYLDLAEPWRLPQTIRHQSDNRVELDRAKHALDLAAEGRQVAVISSGDPGIYAMAAAIFEVLETNANPRWQSIQIQVCPGISAMQAAAAQVGAPLGHDFCTISLSDILKPWEAIAQRVTAAAQTDFAIAFYNPVSKTRTWQLEEAKELLLQWRSPQTPVILARNLGRTGQKTVITTLEKLTVDQVDMRTVVLVGSTKTRQFQAAGRNWIYTPRYY